MNATEFHREITQPLRRQQRRLRLLRAADGLTLAACVALGAMAVQLALDWWLRLRVDLRAGLLLAVLAGCAWALWRHVIAPLRVGFGVREMALALEQRHPELNTLLVSAVDFSAGRVGDATTNSPELVRAVMNEAAQAVRGVSIDALINMRRSRRALGRALAVLVVVVVAFVAAPQTMGIWLDRNLLLRDVSWPQRTQLIVDAPKDGPIRGAIGDDIEIRARVADGYQVPRQVDIFFETASGTSGRETMTGVGERGFRMVFSRAREDFTFYLEGGDDVTETYSVALSERPVVVSAEMTVEPPRYTNLPVQTYPDGQRSAEMYHGSTLTIRAQVSKDLASAALYSGTQVIQRLDADERTLAVAVTPTESQTYQFELLDRDGLTNSRPARFSARIIEDAAPKVRMLAPNVGNLVTQQAVLPLELAFTDELGLADAELVWERSAEAGQSNEEPVEGFKPGMRDFETRRNWTVADTHADIGEALTLTARAHDYNDVTGPGVGSSTTLTFRVATTEEMLAE
ncbi:MAG TPA: hypothetical protein P5572_14730, partial [Phycisphaerae bacterium]|nr:hypothetical protein [Phycisphaerae bacterium]